METGQAASISLPATYPRAGHFTSLSLSSLICKMGILKGPSGCAISRVCVQVVTTVVTTVPRRFSGAATWPRLHLRWPVRAPSPWGTVPRAGWGKAQASPRTSQDPEPSAPASPQALSLKESEKTALSEKLMGTRHSLAAVSLEMERQKRDAQSRQEQDRVGWAGLGGGGVGRGWGGGVARVGGARAGAGPGTKAWLCPAAASRLCWRLRPFLGVATGGRGYSWAL